MTPEADEALRKRYQGYRRREAWADLFNDTLTLLTRLSIIGIAIALLWIAFGGGK